MNTGTEPMGSLSVYSIYILSLLSKVLASGNHWSKEDKRQEVNLDLNYRLEPNPVKHFEIYNS